MENNFEYRKNHGVIRELDFVNFTNAFDNIEEVAVEHSKYATIEKNRKSGAGTIAKGLFKTTFGILGVACGAGWYGAGSASDGIGDVIRDVGGRSITSEIIADVTNDVIEYENRAWKYLNFIRNFIPAEGNIGEVVFKDGSCDDFHCGNGHKFFENGDYFEGYFEDGNIKKGIYIWKSGERYIGEFDEDFNKTGNGLTLYPDGTYYYGQYCEGTKNGVGIQLYTDGVYCGAWEYDTRVCGSLKLENGACFLGEFENDQPVQ